MSIQNIPLPEHPRPDFLRSDWQNLNGTWAFRFDKDNKGIGEQWQNAPDGDFTQTIMVPFPWGSRLSGVKDEAPIAWYRRSITVPESWQGKRVFIVVGASDWQTDGWLDGHALGMHKGGYTPFEFEITHLVAWGTAQELTFRVDDKRRSFALFGKQGYGDVHGLWQTVYLEARGSSYLDTVHYLPDIDDSSVTAKIMLDAPARIPLTYTVNFKLEDRLQPAFIQLKPGQMEASLTIHLDDMKLWDLENPYLYEVESVLSGEGVEDRVQGYFGMRKISVRKMPGTGYPYVALNHKPIYLQLTLDQSYTMDGHYTFPSDEFMKHEIMISKNLGLNGNRIHIKVEVPRKLYWADKLGLLIMADLPNSWGEPTQEMFAEGEHCLRNMIRRDMNHPCIFSWVLYNETWGLATHTTGKDGSKRAAYLPQTQGRVAAMYRLAKSLDPTRLVEDMSACNHDHVISDLNSWHSYNPGYRWANVIEDYDKNTVAGSTFNYINGFRQNGVPMFNSECGNVWGYKGSTGDVDWSWDYHRMMDAFHRHPKCAGWLYTEHHDVCNEWNGYVRFDRSPKFTGIEELFPGMTLNDLHADAYLSLDSELFRTFKPGETWNLPVYVSLTTDRYTGHQLTLSAKIRYWGHYGYLYETPVAVTRPDIYATSWLHAEVGPIPIELPIRRSVGVVCLSLSDGEHVIARNFATFQVRDGEDDRFNENEERQVIRFAPKTFSKAEWSQKQWNVLDGLKVNGTGKGYFEYEIKLPEAVKTDGYRTVIFRAEVSSKRLNGKDAEGDKDLASGLDWMLGGGSYDPSKNPNSYPMTDTVCWKGSVRVVANGDVVHTQELPDDPADHRGILSWAAQPQDKTLHEAGSYGYLVEATIPDETLAKSAATRTLTIRLETDEHGLALYGEQFGRYPLDLMVVFVK